MRQTIQLAKEMGKGLGRSKVLQRPLPSKQKVNKTMKCP
jgi:hypothetical protein